MTYNADGPLVLKLFIIYYIYPLIHSVFQIKNKMSDKGLSLVRCFLFSWYNLCRLLLIFQLYLLDMVNFILINYLYRNKTWYSWCFHCDINHIICTHIHVLMSSLWYQSFNMHTHIHVCMHILYIYNDITSAPHMQDELGQHATYYVDIQFNICMMMCEIIALKCDK